jgi:CDP-diacylglycerol--serine O-phosphatidyltransferase
MPLPSSWTPTWWGRVATETSLGLILPNLITVMALCFGMTALKMAVEGRFALAIFAILIAICLDAADGGIARLVNGASRFGVELDSLADAISFGVAPAVLLYYATLHQLGPIGWCVSLLFAVCVVLRLARFNATTWSSGASTDYFCGMPAPAAAATALFPLYVTLAGYWEPPPLLVAAHLLCVAAMAVSRVPFYSGKSSGARLVRNNKVVILLAVCALSAVSLSNFWLSLAALIMAYLMIAAAGVLHFWGLAHWPSTQTSDASDE